MRILNVIELLVSVLFSLAVLASAIPAFGNISNTIVVIFYLFIPGYNITLLLKEKYNLIFRGGYSVLFGLALVVAIFSMRQLYVGVALPFNVIIPSLTILIALYHYFVPNPLLKIEEAVK